MAAEKETSRVEAFSDGVFAIAITLLVLEIKVPLLREEASPKELWHELGKLWPSYFAFFMSFGTILVLWINHHDGIRMLKSISRPFVFANGFLLLLVTFFPFPTALLAEYIVSNANASAIVFYCGYHIVINIAFHLLFWSCEQPVYLYKPEITQKFLKEIKRKLRLGLIVYSCSTLVSVWFPIPGLILNSLLWVVWTTFSFTEKM